MELPNTETRVMELTPPAINECLRRELEARIYYCAVNPHKIDDRLAELDREWDMERALETSAAGVGLFGVLMAIRNKKWVLLPLAVGGFLMQHALQGWCPPVEIFRRLGVRTTKEINDERYALRALNGDFDHVNISNIQDPAEKAQSALRAIDNNYMEM
jgi:hypothetical protein